MPGLLDEGHPVSEAVAIAALHGKKAAGAAGAGSGGATDGGAGDAGAEGAAEAGRGDGDDQSSLASFLPAEALTEAAGGAHSRR